MVQECKVLAGCVFATDVGIGRNAAILVKVYDVHSFVYIGAPGSNHSEICIAGSPDSRCVAIVLDIFARRVQGYHHDCRHDS